MMDNREHLLKRLGDYGRWIEELVDEGWNAYLTNFMFRHISEWPDVRLAMMKDEVDRVYSKLVTRVERNPTSPARWRFLPIFIGCEDLPVHKSLKEARIKTSPNQGSHINGIFLFPWKSRLRKHPIDLIQDSKKYYIPEGGPLLRIHMKPAHRTLKKMADYSFKALKQGSVGEDELIILPKSLTEVIGRKRKKTG